MKNNFNLRSKSLIWKIFLATGLIACFSCGSINSKNPEKIRVLMVGGGSSHDFDRWYKGADKETLESNEFATVTYTNNTDSIAHYLPETDVLYLTNNQPISNSTDRQAIIDFVEAGNGLVLGHAALWYNWSDWPEYNQQLVGGGSRGHDAYGNFKVSIIEPNHPITENVEKEFNLEDELYYFKPDSNGPGIEVLATASAPGSNDTFPSVFVVDHPKGKIAGIALGHDDESHGLAAYQTILRNAVKWAAK